MASPVRPNICNTSVDTSAPSVPKCLDSGHFGSSDDMSNGQFGTGPKCLGSEVSRVRSVCTHNVETNANVYACEPRDSNALEQLLCSNIIYGNGPITHCHG